MNKVFKMNLLAALIAGMLVPLAASAADADLMSRIDSLSRELEALKSQVKANEAKAAQTAQQVQAVAAKSDAAALDDLKSQVTRLEGKSLGKWLTVGGDYRFRVDSLLGETRTFTDANATFANVQQKLQADFHITHAVWGGLHSLLTVQKRKSGKNVRGMQTRGKKRTSSSSKTTTTMYR